MMYISTRDKNVEVTAAQAITQGISKESGLFVPESLPKLDIARLQRLVSQNYIQRAQDILADFLTDFSQQEINECVQKAYGSGKFTHDSIAPMSKLSPDIYMLELWHGPTCAFKDMALQLLPHLLTVSAKKVIDGKKIAILVATSGDTGKAALEGFKDVEDTEIVVFYPQGGVSEIQRLQMATQQGKNVQVCAVNGNFDDTQTGVKNLFANAEMADKLESENFVFSSANSINWGRLLPQIVYYVSSYCELVATQEIAMGERVNVAVPTGNFGNILAAYYAKEMGLPLGKLICASNENNVLTDFFLNGTYDRRRKFVLTSSPSMDILISSNLERLLFHLYDGDDKQVATLMNELSQNGVYSISDTVMQKITADFFGGYCTESQTASQIEEVFSQYSYLCDTHTAVAVKVHKDYVAQTGDKTKTIVVSTANPYKFVTSILQAVTGKPSTVDEFEQAKQLCAVTGLEIPQQILALQQQAVRFTQCTDIDVMGKIVLQQLKID